MVGVSRLLTLATEWEGDRRSDRAAGLRSPAILR
jgi:hypothetical protein